MIVEIDVLKNKGVAEDFIIKRIYQAERLAKKFDLTNEKIIINEYKKESIGLRKGLQVYNKASTENINNFNDIKDKLSAQDYFRKLIMPNLFSTNKEINYTSQAKEATEQLKLLSESNSAVDIKFFYLRSEIFYNHLINEFETAEYFAKEFLKLINDNHVVNSSDNMGGAYMMLSNMNIYMNNADKAIKYGKEGLPYFHNGGMNQLNLYDCLMVAALLKRDYKYANEILSIARTFSMIKTHHFNRSKWVYFEANLRFLEGKYDTALAILQKQSELTADKSGWRLGYKILEMMCIIELGNYDWLDYRIETFRKLLSTVKKENIHRPKLVLQIIKQFIRSAYDFKVTAVKTENLIQLLTEAKNEYRYDPKGYEVIRFDTWWQSKLKKKPVTQ